MHLPDMTPGAPTAPSRETLVGSVDRVTIPEAIGFQLGGEDLDILAQRAPVSFEQVDRLAFDRIFSAPPHFANV